MASKEATKQLIKDSISFNKVMVFSKTFCPYCKKTKKVLDDLAVEYSTMELDERDDGSMIQDIMLEMTGARSVPRVFINGKFVGGSDETLALHSEGKLITLIKA
ncbi:uncharacterized protein LOC143446100 [Clavelina lepadiformis]|uniref:uncharacterized protein LOC143446100 n=1 Tax=Clavelina lepadiformis TaxID=159417 RepID=UPI00404334EC